MIRLLPLLVMTWALLALVCAPAAAQSGSAEVTFWESVRVIDPRTSFWLRLSAGSVEPLSSMTSIFLMEALNLNQV